MPSVYSKVIRHTCYELGHTWTPSCSMATTEIFISAFIYSCKMYSFVYIVTALLKRKKLNKDRLLQLLKDFIRSSTFLTINGFGYVGVSCIIGRILPHVTYFTASFFSGFVSAILAILVERPSRRAMLAVYVTNVASECFFNALVGSGAVQPLPRGEVLIFVASLAVLGWYHRNPHGPPLPPLMLSVLRFFVGPHEGACNLQPQQRHLQQQQQQQPGVVAALLRWVRARHPLCSHPGSCCTHAVKGGASGLLTGAAIRSSLSLLYSVPTLLRAPLTLPHVLYAALSGSRSNRQLPLFLAWVGAVVRGVGCVGRRLRGVDDPMHGAVAGAMAGLGMFVYPAPSVALYTMWKTVEVVHEQLVSAGTIPSVPGGVELLYAVMTGYLFHAAAVYQHYVKPSYWRFLLNLTDQRMSEFNRHLLHPFGQDSARNFKNFWPAYDENHLTPAFLKAYPLGLASVPLYRTQ